MPHCRPRSSVPRRETRALAAALLVATTAGCPGGRLGDDYDLRGRIVDAAGAPREGVLVSMAGVEFGDGPGCPREPQATTRTDAAGRYGFRVRPGAITALPLSLSPRSSPARARFCVRIEDAAGGVASLTFQGEEGRVIGAPDLAAWDSDVRAERGDDGITLDWTPHALAWAHRVLVFSGADLIWERSIEVGQATVRLPARAFEDHPDLAIELRAVGYLAFPDLGYGPGATVDLVAPRVPIAQPFPAAPSRGAACAGRGVDTGRPCAFTDGARAPVDVDWPSLQVTFAAPMRPRFLVLRGAYREPELRVETSADGVTWAVALFDTNRLSDVEMVAERDVRHLRLVGTDEDRPALDRLGEVSVFP